MNEDAGTEVSTLAKRARDVFSHNRSISRDLASENTSRGSGVQDVVSVPHQLSVTTYNTSTFCDYCNELLFGIIQQGLYCSECGNNYHKNCVYKFKNHCYGMAGDGSTPKPLPVIPHRFVVMTFPPAVSCDVCKGQLTGKLRQGMRCQDCFVIAHADCTKSCAKLCDPRQFRDRQASVSSERSVRSDLGLQFSPASKDDCHTGIPSNIRLHRLMVRNDAEDSVYDSEVEEEAVMDALRQRRKSTLSNDMLGMSECEGMEISSSESSPARQWRPPRKRNSNRSITSDYNDTSTDDMPLGMNNREFQASSLPASLTQSPMVTPHLTPSGSPSGSPGARRSQTSDEMRNAYATLGNGPFNNVRKSSSSSKQPTLWEYDPAAAAITSAQEQTQKTDSRETGAANTMQGEMSTISEHCPTGLATENESSDVGDNNDESNGAGGVGLDTVDVSGVAYGSSTSIISMGENNNSSSNNNNNSKHSAEKTENGATDSESLDSTVSLSSTGPPITAETSSGAVVHRPRKRFLNTDLPQQPVLKSPSSSDAVVPGVPTSPPERKQKRIIDISRNRKDLIAALQGQSADPITAEELDQLKKEPVHSHRFTQVVYSLPHTCSGCKKVIWNNALKCSECFCHLHQKCRFFAPQCRPRPKANLQSKGDILMKGEVQITQSKDEDFRRRRYLMLDKRRLGIYAQQDDSKAVEIIPLSYILAVNVTDPKEATGPPQGRCSFLVITRKCTYDVNVENAAIRHEWVSALNMAVAKSNLSGSGSVEENYELMDIIGQGQFGVVCNARDKKTNKIVAVKIIKERSWEKSPRPISQELRIMSKLKLPGVIEMVSVYDADGKIFIVMEKADGGDFLERVMQGEQGQLTERIVKFVLFQTLVAINYLHRHGVVHRDIKPENILMVTRDEFTQAKLCDFGFAKAMGEERFLSSIVGTPAYVAPEVLTAASYGPQVDLWSVGVIAYVALSGVFPFNEDEDIHSQILTAHFLFPPELWANISDLAKSFILGLLVLDPNGRFTIDSSLSHPWMTDDQLFRDLVDTERRLKLGNYLSLHFKTPSAEKRSGSTAGAGTRSGSMSQSQPTTPFGTPPK
eukprot:comp18700_c0_seq1/m.20420 comp18700_c0_seq1/g.20420  ORF comp18700_c0_seq1/g.20420 comp18700_c0_seq1/m.20420 type:complete len:1087 (-) comp18700_c0_seq1:71-3331(-)